MADYTELINSYVAGPQLLRHAVSGYPNVKRAVFYEEVGASDRQGVDHDFEGRIDIGRIEADVLLPEADYYLCGPVAFMREQRDALLARGVDASRIHTEIFGSGMLYRRKRTLQAHCTVSIPNEIDAAPKRGVVRMRWQNQRLNQPKTRQTYSPETLRFTARYPEGEIESRRRKIRARRSPRGTPQRCAISSIGRLVCASSRQLASSRVRSRYSEGVSPVCVLKWRRKLRMLICATRAASATEIGWW